METFKSILKAILSDHLAVFGLIMILIFIIIAIFAPQIAPYGPREIVKNPETGQVAKYEPPSKYFWFGTNNLARDIFSQVVYGSRIALIVGFLSAFLVVIVGANVGLLAGYYGGWIGEILMRIVDIAYAIPFIPFAVLLVGILQPNVSNLVLVMALLMWRAPARVVRAQVLSLTQRPFVKSAKVAGASNLRIIYQHIAPNIMPFVVLYVPITMGWAIISEASVSFLGFGDPRMISWGGMLQIAFTSGAMRIAWWWTLFPGMAIVLVVISVYFIGRALEPIANPKLLE